MKNAFMINNIRKLYGLPKMDRKSRLLESGDYATDSFILLAKKYEPQKWKFKRFTGEMEFEQTSKLLEKYSSDMHELEPDNICFLDESYPTIALKSDHHTTFIKPQYLAIFTDIKYMDHFKLDLDKVKLKQGDDWMSEIFIEYREELIGVVMPHRPSDQVKSFYNITKE